MPSIKKVVARLILEYLRFFAKLQIAKIHPEIIGVGGASGKSSLTELIGIVLKNKYIVNTTKEKNSETGIPLHILGLHMDKFSYGSWLRAILLAPIHVISNWKRYQVLVAEMGIDSPVEPKNMSYLLKIIQPSIGVVTNISLEHSVYFDPYVKDLSEEEKKEKILELTAQQENMLLTSLPKSGVAIVNLDDQYISKSQKKVSASQITVSLYNKEADLFAKHIMIDNSQFAMEFFYQNKEYILKISQPLPLHFAYEFLLAIAIGVSLEVPIEQAIRSIEKGFSLPPGRMSVFEGIKHTTIIDSSYNNATLTPILDMLEFLSKIARKRRKVAIIGDMRELGSQSKENHEVLADKILREVDFAIIIGPLLRNYTAPIFRRKNFPFASFLTYTDAKEFILKTIQENDVILVKGSQNTLFLERVVEMLLVHKEDIGKLCRRGEFWNKKRAETL